MAAIKNSPRTANGKAIPTRNFKNSQKAYDHALETSTLYTNPVTQLKPRKDETET